jgi:IS66 Orf2 like protein
MRSRLAKLRQELQQYQRSDRPLAARYPAALRQEIAHLAQHAHASGTSFASFARSLGVTPTPVLRSRPRDERRPRRSAGAVRPVLVTPIEVPAPPARGHAHHATVGDANRGARPPGDRGPGPGAAMIGSTRQIKAFASGRPVDMRKGFEGLAALVRDELAADVLSGDPYLFTGKNRKRAKVLLWDGTGLCLFANQQSSHYTSFNFI